jgi:putative ABC transport system substrate-binding protein
MRRRDFIKVVVGSAVTLPAAARAQSSLPVVGFLSSRSPAESELDVAGFRQGLSQSGYVEDQNVAIEYRWAENQYDRLPALAAELVKREVRVIAAVGGPVTALAVKAATKTIPFVFVVGVDPVKLGLVNSSPNREVTRLG